MTTTPRDKGLRLVQKMTSAERAPTHDDRVECAILGSMLIDPAIIERVLERGVTTRHFYRLGNGLIFNAILALHRDGSPVDLVTLGYRMRQDNSIEEIGGEIRLNELFNEIPTTANLESYLSALMRLFAVRCRETAALDALKYLERGQYNRAAELFRVASRPVDESGAGQENPQVLPISPQYGVWRGCYVKRNYRGTDEVAPTPITNFIVSIICEEWADDGAGGNERRIRLSGQLETGEKLCEASVPAKDWANVNIWLHEKWGVRPVIHTVSTQFLKVVAMQHQDVLERRFFTHTGWAKTASGRHVFLLASGTVAGAPEAREELCSGADVAVHSKLAGYQIPAEVTSDQVATAYDWIERLMECADRRVTAPLVAIQFLAPLASILRPDLALWISGRSGTRKSSLVAAAMAVWGPGWTRDTLPGSWRSTANAILELGFQAKDLPLVIDNFVPDARGREQEKLSTVAYSIGDHANRDRCTAGAALKTARPVRSLVISTGEDGPQGDGQTNRFYMLQMTDDSTKSMALEEVQEAGWRGEMAPAMTHYLNWLAAKMDEPGFVDKVRAYYMTMVKEARRIGSAHMRLPEQTAWVRVGIALAKSSHPRRGWTSTSMEDEIAEALLQSTATREQIARESRLAHRFCACVDYLIRIGEVRGASRKTGGAPEMHPHAFGWRNYVPHEAGDTSAIMRADAPTARVAVWIDVDTRGWYVCVDVTILTTIKETLRTGGIAESARSVALAMMAEKMVTDIDTDRYTSRLTTHDGRRARVWRIHGDAYLAALGVQDEAGD